MTADDEKQCLKEALTLFVLKASKELGEISKEVVFDTLESGHWKNELSDLCLVINKVLILANTDFNAACLIGEKRKAVKIAAKTQK